ncbi:MAG: hypothetical protein IJY44_05100 [Bacteroidaceae bacterium]|nr:hypothetical protein [Bacteroidaceae bacterium]
MKKYQKPTFQEVELSPQYVITTSGLKFTDESADKEYEVLSSEYRGDWGNLWK